MLAAEFKSVMLPESPVLREPLIRRFQNDLPDGLADLACYPVYRYQKFHRSPLTDMRSFLHIRALQYIL
jgi:hypothetical protein